MEAVVANNIVGVTQNIVGVTANNQIIVQQQVAQAVQNAKFVTAVNFNQHVNNGQTITIMKPIQPMAAQDHGGQVGFFFLFTLTYVQSNLIRGRFET